MLRLIAMSGRNLLGSMAHQSSQSVIRDPRKKIML